MYCINKCNPPLYMFITSERYRYTGCFAKINNNGNEEYNYSMNSRIYHYAVLGKGENHKVIDKKRYVVQYLHSCENIELSGRV